MYCPVGAGLSGWNPVWQPGSGRRRIKNAGNHSSGLALSNLGDMQKLAQGFNQAAEKAGVQMCCDCVGGMFGFYFLPTVPTSYSEVTTGDMKRFKRFSAKCWRRYWSGAVGI